MSPWIATFVVQHPLERRTVENPDVGLVGSFPGACLGTVVGQDGYVNEDPGYYDHSNELDQAESTGFVPIGEQDEYPFPASVAVVCLYSQHSSVFTYRFGESQDGDLRFQPWRATPDMEPDFSRDSSLW